MPVALPFVCHVDADADDGSASAETTGAAAIALHDQARHTYLLGEAHRSSHRL
jgi:hypothetical protein